MTPLLLPAGSLVISEVSWLKVEPNGIDMALGVVPEVPTPSMLTFSKLTGPYVLYPPLVGESTGSSIMV